MQRRTHQAAETWRRVRENNKTYRHGALTEEEGLAINWHSPGSERSSQVFCVSVFGSLHALPDGEAILTQLLKATLPHLAEQRRWSRPRFEHTNRGYLDEQGGTPTSIDAFLQADSAVLCIESKIIADAAEGFGGCSQVRPSKQRLSDGTFVIHPPRCAGYFGVGSDRESRTRIDPVSGVEHTKPCRLAVKDGRRSARAYWEHGAEYFRPDALHHQSAGARCAFQGNSFQLMRNVLFAARAAHEMANVVDGAEVLEFGVLAIAPKRLVRVIETQAESFSSEILRPEHRHRVNVATYDDLGRLLAASPHEASRRLAAFIDERIATLT